MEWTTLALSTLIQIQPHSWRNEDFTQIIRTVCHHDRTDFLVPEQWPDVPSFYRQDGVLVTDPGPHGRYITISPAWDGGARVIEIDGLKLRIELPERPDPCAE